MMRLFPPMMRKLLGASALSMALALPVAAEELARFPEVARDFAGSVSFAPAEGRGPIYAGMQVNVSGQGFAPGQSVTLMQGTTTLIDTPVVADAEGKVAFDFTLPADAALGIHPLVLVAAEPQAAVIAELKISPKLEAQGAELFDIVSAPVTRGLYQVAYSTSNDAVFVTAAVGRPPVKESTLVRLDPNTLEIVATATPLAAPARPDGADGGLFAVYGVDVDDANGTVWTTVTRQNTIAVYSQADLSLIKQFEPGTVNHARDVLVDENRGRAYVSAAFSNVIEVFDTAGLEKIATIEIPSGKRGEDFTTMSLALDEQGGKLYTVSMRTGELAVIDVNTNAVVKVLPLPGALNASGVDIDPVTGRAFIASQKSDNLLIVDIESGELIKDVAVGAGALNVAFEPVARRVYVSNRGAGTTVVTDVDGEIIAVLEGKTMPNHATVDAKGRVWAVNKSFGENDPNGDHLKRISPRS